MRLPLLGAVALCLPSCLAVFADEAWTVDYHHALLGLPREETTFLHQPNPSSRASLIYTISDQGVVGAVNPRDGLLVWRQTLSHAAGASNSTFLRAGDGQDLVLSGHGDQVNAWSAADGRLAWTRGVGGQIEDLEIIELPDGTDAPGAKDAVVLTSGDHASVQRLDGTTGTPTWTHSVASTDMPYQVSASATQLYAILLHKTMLGYIKIKVIILDPVTGQKLDEYMLSSDSELATADNIIAVGANSASPIIAWTDAAHSVLKVNIIGTKTIASFNLDSGVDCVRLHAPFRPNSLAHFLVHYEGAASHWAEVFHVDLPHGKVEKAYQLPKVSGKGTFSTSTSDANVYFTRITSGEVMTVSSASHGILGRWPLNNFGTVAASGETVVPVHAVSETSTKGDAVSALRSAVLLSSGEWVLLRDGSAVWQRPEMLAATVAASFVTPAKVDAFAHDLDVEAHSGLVSAYLHRVTRHVQDLSQLPGVLSTIPQRIANALVGTTADADAAADAFGFHQILACATADGRVVALDAANPSRILWNRRVMVPERGQSWEPRIISNSEGGLELVSGTTGQHWSLNATDGNDVTSSTHLTTSIPASANITFTMRDGVLEAAKDGVPGVIWTFLPPASERILSLVSRPVNDPVASIGKVLGDRRVLYKYLSPNLALVVTASETASIASFYVLDTVSGAAISSSVHAGVDLQAPISAIMSENWFAYSYTSQYSDNTPKGYQLVVGEMFESLVPNDRGPLSARSNYSSLQSDAEPFVITKTYQIPEAIAKLSVTQTRQGITSRQLLAVLPESNALVGIPYHVLDPRRPINRDPTKEEQAEGLSRYVPTIEFDPKWYLNHKREVIGIKNVITSPALIESTSLVFAYGLDIFGTRLSPSFSFDILGNDFNKFQMLATVAALAVATFVVAPLVSHGSLQHRWTRELQANISQVTRKQINTRWAFS